MADAAVADTKASDWSIIGADFALDPAKLVTTSDLPYVEAQKALQLTIVPLAPTKFMEFNSAATRDGTGSHFQRWPVNEASSSETNNLEELAWALYGGMHNYKTVQFLLDVGARVDEE
ncbi:hypothetical protein B0A55_09983 [Friedmanniomyces simplex]|uniref:Uncharacterized protein n=1 Tax=Friedmanniomyces simplex TaxID=329884 RepID=A0A4U0WZ39_9PEZI|nr:hypothetical protein B0A55_09983 [Friedmanniomyces simplex]